MRRGAGRFELVAVVATTTTACRSARKDVVGAFVGDADLRVAFPDIAFADGGVSTFIETAPRKPARVTIALTAGDAYSIRLETPWTTCTLKAHWNDPRKRIEVDGPGKDIHLAHVDVPAGSGPPWQLCHLKTSSFEGDVQLAGHARSTLDRRATSRSSARRTASFAESVEPSASAR